MEMSFGTNDTKQRVAIIDIEGGDGEELQSQMTKTRSYGDLIRAQDHVSIVHRRLSDPSISIEKWDIWLSVLFFYQTKFIAIVAYNWITNKKTQFFRKFDTLNLENLDDELNNVDDISDNKQQLVNSETNQVKPNLLNGKQESNDSTVNPSVDSSTDTLIPNGDFIVNTPLDKKDKCVINRLKPKPQEPTCWGLFSQFVFIDCRISRLDIELTLDTEQNYTGNIKAACNCNRNHAEGSEASDMSVPLMSQTPSSIPSPIHQEVMIDNPDRLDDVDGLPVIHCDVQMRLQQIIVEQKVRLVFFLFFPFYINNYIRIKNVISVFCSAQGGGVEKRVTHN